MCVFTLEIVYLVRNVQYESLETTMSTLLSQNLRHKIKRFKWSMH